MKVLKIAFIQSDIHWHNIGANLAMFEEKIWHLKGEVNVIVLPEMFQTGFTMEAQKLAEPMNFTTFKWLKQMAALTRAAVAGSYVVKENGNYYNRLIWMQPDGAFHTYDKRHLFRMAKEDQYYGEGNTRTIVEWMGWRIALFICYDLRFPVWTRNRWNTAENQPEYDLAVFVANWPQARIGAWDILLKARAIENLCYVSGVNRTGTDGNGIAYNGHSAIIDPRGLELTKLNAEESEPITVLEKEKLNGFRKKFPAHLDADDFTIHSQ